MLIGARFVAAAAVAFLASVTSYAQSVPDCAALDAATTTRALQVAARNMGNDSSPPTVDRETLLPGTCYWQLFVLLPHQRGHSILYVSPDHHFISPVLWDLTVDFDKEDANLETQLREEADTDHPPIHGPESAPVTIVLFSDFQCPYCAAFSRIVEQYQGDNPGKLRLVFRNNPLPMHKWARDAARAGICVARENPEAFWKFQDFMFAKQKETTADNFGEEIKEFLQSVPVVSNEKYLECMATPYPGMRLEKDIEEANAYRIHSTPTLFINGRRYGGFANAAEFAAAVDAGIHSETAKQTEKAK
jgi:protein-disulfide isomerase